MARAERVGVERVGVIVPAAGEGRRLGASKNKALVDLCARPILSWTLAGVEANDSVDSIVVVAHLDDLDVVEALIAADGSAKVSAVVAGGATRRASVAAGLAALGPGPAYVAVHDACRPLLAPGAIDRLAGLLEELGADGVAPGAPVTDTVRHVATGDHSGGLVDREQLRALQTPQVFLRAALQQAHARAARDADEIGAAGEVPASAEAPTAGGDRNGARAGRADEATDAVLLDRAGFRVALVNGQLENLTISSALDLEVAEVLLSRASRGQAAR